MSAWANSPTTSPRSTNRRAGSWTASGCGRSRWSRMPKKGAATGWRPCATAGRPLLSVRETSTHLSVFPFSADVVEAVAPELEGYSLSTGTIRFSVDKPLPNSIIDQLVDLRRIEIDEALET